MRLGFFAAVSALAMSLLAAAPIRASTVDPLRDEFVQEGLGRKVDAVLSRWTHFGFSGTVLLERDGVIWLHKSYGPAERAEARRHRTDSPFPADPLIRQFLTLAILRLEMESRLSTTDRLEVLLDPILTEERGLALHDLLCDRGAASERLAAVVEKATGEPSDRVILERFLAPAGMRATGPLSDGGDSLIVFGHHAEKSRLRTIGKLPASGWWINRFGSTLQKNAARMRSTKPVASLPFTVLFATTAGDLYQLELAFRGDTFLNADAKQKLFNPIANDRSYGWVFGRTSQGRSRVSLEADGAGTEIGIYRYPDGQATLILLLDNDMGWRLPVRGMIEGASFSAGSIWVYAVALAVLLYVVIRSAMGRRVGEPWLRREKRRERSRRFQR